MRMGLPAALFLLAAACVSAAQPPTVPAGPGKLVIRPGGSGAVPVGPGGTDPDEKPGFIVIRPNGKGVLNRPPAAPKQPTLVAGRAASGTLNVPPPDPAQADGALFDYWFAVGIDGQRVGHVNWSAKEMKQKDRVFAVGVRSLNLTLARFGQVVTQWGEESTVESPDGEVYVTSMRQGIGKDQALALTGTVEGKTLKVKGRGAAEGASDTPWPGGVVGLVREPRLFKELNLKPGEAADYPTYIPTVNRVVKTTITFEGEETKTLWDKTPARKLLRFHTRPEPIGKVKLPASTTWVDAETFEPLQLETDFPALGGRLTFLRTTKEAASAPVTRPVEVFNAQSIRLNREIAGIHTRGSVVYRVSAPRDDEPGTLFADEPRQRVKNLDEKARSFELHVSAARGPETGVKPQPEPGKEYTASSYFINWDNEAVKGLAAKAVERLPAAASSWEKAAAVEAWVKANMKAFEFSQAMATADNVAKSLTGDCTEYAMLSAAMCRALGVPSRTALGLVYAPGKDGKPYLAYHMWFEVFAGGQWLPLDATLGQGGVGPGHVKISDHHWHEEKSFAPLLPVLRTLSAKPEVEVATVR
jgi:transglutaminase-like putative cysteine protease